MAISPSKKELEKKKGQKRKEKQQRKEERKAGGNKSFEDMIAYVDENGMITDAPPDPDKKMEVDLELIAISTPKKEVTEEAAQEGAVEHFNPDRGYGFIRERSGAEKYFFHISQAPPGIAEGDAVTFELEWGDRGMNAVNITRIP